MNDQGTIKKLVREIEVGDLVDLEGDKYADTCCDPAIAFAFASVDEIEQDGVTCIVLHTSQGSFGFPPDHLIEWMPTTVRREKP